MARIYGKGCFLVGHKFIHFADGKVDTDDKAIIDAAMLNNYAIDGFEADKVSLPEVEAPKRGKKKVANDE